MSVQDAIQGCRFIASTYSAVQQIAELRDLLAEWIEKRRASIHSAYMSFRSEGILFVVMQEGVERDEKLASDLTELDIAIASSDEFDELTVDVLSIPRSSSTAAAAFLSSGNVQQYAGQERPRDPGD